MKVMWGIIYRVTNLVKRNKDGSPRGYDGLSTQDDGMNRRRKDHEHAARRGSTYTFHRALRKYGFDNFKWEVIHRVFGSLLELAKLEIEQIHKDGFCGKNGYNMDEGGAVSSDETRRKISRTLMGKKCSLTTIRNMTRAANTPARKETSSKLGKKSKGKNHSLVAIRNHERAANTPARKESSSKSGKKSKGRKLSLKASRNMSTVALKREVNKKQRKSKALRERMRILQTQLDTTRAIIKEE